MRSKCVQDYYTSWGLIYLDAGVRAFFFGQSRLTGGGRGCAPDGSGCSRVATAGAAGFEVVLQNLKAHAVQKGYGQVFFGPQAASGFQLENGTELADWTYGAQHLYASQNWLVQPFSIAGSPPLTRSQWYGSTDTHDANRVNNENGIPVLLDFDNYSGDEDRPDDIRRLSSWPNSTRAAFVRTLWHTLRLYNPRASLSLPMSKSAGGNWPAFTQPQGQCWSGRWGGNDGLYFGAVSCGIVNVTADLFAQPEQPTPIDILEAVDSNHFGTALQSTDLTAVWAFRTIHTRDFTSLAEYNATVRLLPWNGLVIGARGKRCTLARTLVASPEFMMSPCSNHITCTTDRLAQFLCLGRPDCVKLATRKSHNASDRMEVVVVAMCDAADSLSLFGNAALMDPGWKIGDPPAAALKSDDTERQTGTCPNCVHLLHFGFSDNEPCLRSMTSPARPRRQSTT